MTSSLDQVEHLFDSYPDLDQDKILKLLLHALSSFPLAVSLPMTKESFTQDKQIIFQEWIAKNSRAAGGEAADVTIDKIEIISGRTGLLAESIRVEFRVYTIASK